MREKCIKLTLQTSLPAILKQIPVNMLDVHDKTTKVNKEINNVLMAIMCVASP